MTAPIFTPPRAPSVETSRAMKPRVLVAQFGDGYEQRAVDGLNAQLETMTVAWSRLSPVMGKTITDFFAARGGAEAFQWTAPHDTTAKLWICDSWDTGHPNQVHVSIRATFRQVPA